MPQQRTTAPDHAPDSGGDSPAVSRDRPRKHATRSLPWLVILGVLSLVVIWVLVMVYGLQN
ncbi:MAG: hypothetical protein GY716_24670 [bacterium]|nr:hypothetical protein [bacterium]